MDELTDSARLDEPSEIHVGFRTRKVIECDNLILGSCGRLGLSGHGNAPLIRVGDRNRKAGYITAMDNAMVSISSYLEDDHRRIERFLENSPEQYPEFRAALARHIGMEEKILFPA